jgi:hypothetical protein
MTIDVGRELAVRSIAHNLSYRFSEDADYEDVLDYAQRLAGLMAVPGDPDHLVAAAVTLWQAIRTDGEPAPVEVQVGERHG